MIAATCASVVGQARRWYRRRNRRARACPRRASAAPGSRRVSPRSCRAARARAARWTSAGAETTITLSTLRLAAGFEQQGNVEQQRSAHRVGGDEARRARRAPRDGRSPRAAASSSGSPSTRAAKRVAVEPPVARPRRESAPPIGSTSAPPGPCSRRTSASASNTGMPARSNIAATVDLPMPIEPVSAILIMRAISPRSRSAPSNGSSGMPRMVKWLPSIASNNCTPRPSIRNTPTQ